MNDSTPKVSQNMLIYCHQQSSNFALRMSGKLACFPVSDHEYESVWPDGAQFQSKCLVPFQIKELHGGQLYITRRLVLKKTVFLPGRVR